MKIGDKVQATMHNGYVYKGVVSAITKFTSGTRVTIKLGNTRVMTADEKQCSAQDE